MPLIGVKLGGDNSEFKAMMRDSVAEAGKSAGELAGRVSGKLTGMKDVSQAVATALGLNLQNIAENVARAWTGMAKDQEQAWKDLEAVSDRVTESRIKNMKATLTEEQRYQLALAERAKLQEQVEAGAGASGKEQLKLKQAELQLEGKIAEIIEYENKLRDEAVKKAEKLVAKAFEQGEAAVQAQINTLKGEEKILALKQNIADTQAILNTGALEQANAEKFSVILAERKNQLLAEEAKAAEEVARIEKGNNDAALKSYEKQLDVKRTELPLQERRKAILADIKNIEAQIKQDAEAGLDVSKDMARLDDLRGKLRETEKEQGEANVEIAKLLLKGKEKLTDEEKLQLELLTGQTTQAKINAEIAILTGKIIAGTILPEEEKRLAVLINQGREIRNQVGAMGDLNKAAKEFIQTITRTGSSYSNQSTTALEGVRARVKAQLDQVKQQNLLERPGYKNPMEYSLQSEFNQIESELDSRRIVGEYAGRMGEDAARRKYGDTATDKALRDLTTDQARSGQSLETIVGMLQRSPFFGG